MFLMVSSINSKYHCCLVFLMILAVQSSCCSEMFLMVAAVGGCCSEIFLMVAAEMDLTDLNAMELFGDTAGLSSDEEDKANRQRGGEDDDDDNVTRRVCSPYI